MGQRLQALCEATGSLGFLERFDQVCERAIVHAPAVLGRGDRQADGEMRFADTRWTQEDHVLLPFDKAELMERIDLLSLDGRLKREVEIRQHLDGPAVARTA